MKTIWVIQCRNENMTHALLLFYEDMDEAFEDEEQYRKEYKYVALESYTLN